MFGLWAVTRTNSVVAISDIILKFYVLSYLDFQYILKTGSILQVSEYFDAEGRLLKMPLKNLDMITSLDISLFVMREIADLEQFKVPTITCVLIEPHC